MKILRASLYKAPFWSAAMTGVIRETDLRRDETVDSALRRMTTPVPSHFVYGEIFEVINAPTIADAAFQAEERRRENLPELNMAMLYFWTALQFPKCNPGGAILTTQPAPLDKDQIANVLKQLSVHEQYKNFMISVISKEMEIIRMAKGDILPIERM